jgi:hypothetical protein
MKSFISNILFAFTLTCGSFSLSAQLVVLDNLSSTVTNFLDVGDVSFGQGLANLRVAQVFMTGGTAYTNEPITVSLNIIAPAGGGSNFRVDIYDDSGGNPGSLILPLSGNAMPGAGFHSYTGNANFTANTSYFIVISADFSFPVYKVGSRPQNDNNINTDEGFDAINQRQVINTEGAGWSSAPGRVQFSLQLDDIIVPVELSEFKGEPKKNMNLLEWTTASETNNDYFEIQHSIDGTTFNTIGTENGHGTTSKKVSYNYEHHNPGIGTHYYRLKQIDFDGQFEYSEMISIFVQSDVEMLVYPNPTSNQLTIVNGRGNGTIYNLLGQVVKSLFIDNDESTFHISELPNGQYWLRILQPNGNVITRKIIKS